MNTNHRVDVVVADAAAPAPRVIFLASTKRAGLEEARLRGIVPIAILTPRSIDAARGLLADRIVASNTLTAEERKHLAAHAMPSLVSRSSR